MIGVNDKTHEAVPLGSCDPRHVIEKEGKEAYLRKEVLDRFDRPERKWIIQPRILTSHTPRPVISHAEAQRARSFRGYLV